VQDIDCDELYEREETKEGFIMGYGKSTVCHFDTRVVMGADYEAYRRCFDSGEWLTI
jgi:hypothetical protein